MTSIEWTDATGTIPIIGEGPGSHIKRGGIIGAPYLDGVQHLEFPTTKAEVIQ